jgi:hypothetical protein
VAIVLLVSGLQFDDNLLSHMRQKVARRPAIKFMAGPGRRRKNARQKIRAAQVDSDILHLQYKPAISTFVV